VRTYLFLSYYSIAGEMKLRLESFPGVDLVQKSFR